MLVSLVSARLGIGFVPEWTQDLPNRGFELKKVRGVDFKIGLGVAWNREDLTASSIARSLVRPGRKGERGRPMVARSATGRELGRKTEHEAAGQSVPRLLRTTLLKLLRLPFFTPSCDANSRFCSGYNATSCTWRVSR